MQNKKQAKIYFIYFKLEVWQPYYILILLEQLTYCKTHIERWHLEPSLLYRIYLELLAKSLLSISIVSFCSFIQAKQTPNKYMCLPSTGYRKKAALAQWQLT